MLLNYFTIITYSVHRFIVRLEYFIHAGHIVGRNLQKGKRLHIRGRTRKAQHFSKLFVTKRYP